MRKRSYNDIVFDSVLEMKYFRDVVCPKEESGEIIYYELQKPYELQPKFKHDGRTVQPIMYVADFFIRYKDGKEEVIDTKGCPDSSAILKRKMFWYIYPDIDYKWISYSKKDGGWILYDDLKKLRNERKRNKKKNSEVKDNG